MKIFAMATLVVSMGFVAVDLSAGEAVIPWHWDDVEYVDTDAQSSTENVARTEEYSELGW